MSSLLERRSQRSVSFNNDKIQIQQQQQQLQPSDQSQILQSPLVPNKKSAQINKLPAINRSTIKYEFNAEGQEICNHHAFCSHLYEFNDQSAILYPLSQPMSIQSGAQLPPAREFESRGIQEENNNNSKNAKKIDNNNNRKSMLSADRTSANNNSNAPAPTNGTRLKVTSSGSITEEALDDWIAQSQNRPIVSFLDPYKKFNVPDKLLMDFKNRYRKLFMSKERDFEKKLLYFEDRSKVSTIPHYQLPTRRPKEEEKSLTFRFKELQPKNINGTSIAVRENYQWKHITFKVKQEIVNQSKNNMSGIGDNKDRDDDYEDGAGKGIELTHVLRNISNNNSYHIKEQQIFNRSRATRSYSHGIDNSSNVNQQGEKSVRNNNNNSNNNVVDKSIDRVSLNRSSIIGLLDKGKVNKSIDRSINNSNKKGNGKQDKNDAEDNDEEEDEQRSYEAIAERVIEQLRDEEDKTKRGMIVISATKNQEDNSSTNSNSNTSGGGFCGHIDCYLEVAKIEKSEMNQVQFSFWKSVRRIQKQAYSQAISCLKETLQYDRLHFHAIFNLACIYEKLGFYDLGLAWFEIAKDIVDLEKQESDDTRRNHGQYNMSLFEQLRFQLVHYGIAICSYHLGSYQISLNHVNLVISAASSSDILGNASSKNNRKSTDRNSLSDISNDYSYSSYHRVIEQKYLRAVCFKQLKLEPQAAQEYAMFQKDTCPKDFKLLMRLMIAVIFKKRRDLEIHVSARVLCNFQSLIQQILAPSSYTPALQPFWEDNQWVDMNYLLKRVKLMSFFCRFDEIELKSVLPSAKFNVIAKSTVIFPKKDWVMVIASGSVIMQSHKYAIELPETIAYFNEGDIIGLPDKDNQLSVSPGVWLTAQTEIEILLFPKNCFMELWKKHAFNDVKTNQILNVIANHQLLVGISELTLYKLAYELIELCNFEEGEVIFSEGEIIDKANGLKLTKAEKQGSSKPSQAEKVANKRKQEFLKRKINGLFIIKRGICELDTTTANWCEYKLKESDYFGECLLFDGMSVTQFGRIVAKSKVVETFCIPRKAFTSIPLPDQMIIQRNAMNSSKQNDYNRLSSNLAKYKQQQMS